MTEPKDVLEALRATIAAAANELDADLLLYSGVIDERGFEELASLVETLKTRTNVLLQLTTQGGEPDSAYRIARCLQNAYGDGKFTLFVDTNCKSAGTLIALGADELVMSNAAELGPLDIQLVKPDALAERTSGLTPKQAITTLHNHAGESFVNFFLSLRVGSGLQITTRTALEVATRLTTGLFGPVFEQIDPMRLGEISRAMLIAEEYGTRLASSNLRKDAIKRLIHDYPSHGFVIDRQEAKEVFFKVRAPSKCERLLGIGLSPFVRDGLGEDGPRVEFLNTLGDTEIAKSTERENNDERSDRSSDVQEGAGREGENNPQYVGKDSGVHATPATRPRRKAGKRKRK